MDTNALNYLFIDGHLVRFDDESTRRSYEKKRYIASVYKDIYGREPDERHLNELYNAFVEREVEFLF